MELRRPTAMDAWKAALHHIREEGTAFLDNDRRTCKETLNLAVTIEHPEVGIEEPIDAIKRTEKWVYPSKDELVSITFNDRDLPLYDYTYGSRLFNHQGTKDQVNGYVIPLLRDNPASRRAVAIAVDVQRDLDQKNRNSPGLVSLHFKVQEGRLLMTAVIRSNDFFIGWPANIYQLGTLQHYVADKLGLRQGALTTYSISAHIFAEHEEDIAEVLQT